MKRERVVLSGAEVRALIDACNGGPTGTRNAALIGLLYRTGLRIAEALELRPTDLRDTWAHVRTGKGGKPRTVPLDAHALELLEAWRAVRPLAPWLFCTLHGAKLQASYVRALLPRLAREAGIEKRVHAHALRHSFAFELAQEGVPLHQVQRLLGHSSLATTSLYVDHLGARDLADAVTRRPWAQ